MRKVIIGAGIAVFIIISTLIFLARPKPKYYQSDVPKLITVEIYGEINFPGKYQVLENSTLKELIDFCQGVTNNADLAKINLNEVLAANHRYDIPSTKEDENKPYQFNLNEVTYQILITIPNITETRAINILTYRESVGKFTSVEELLNVKGIGEVTFSKIKDHFYIR